jgi:CTP:molybdopterin cytidylyltransferase MocA
VSGVDAVVVAAGASTRMGGLDKLRAPVAGRPLLAWTLDAIAAAPIVRRVVVVTAAPRVPEVAGASWLPGSVVAVVAGGARRQESVAAGVAALGDGDPGDVVLVHDGARPLVPAALIRRIIREAAAHGAAVPALPVEDTRSSSLRGVYNAVLDAYVGDRGWMGLHRIKTYGFLEVAFKVGRQVTTGARFTGLFKDRTWDKVDDELAIALKPVVLPGEAMRVFIIKEGKEKDQGVAYLDDGTMVVVDNSRRMIGQTIDVTVTSVLQTTVGKMIFGRFNEER